MSSSEICYLVKTYAPTPTPTPPPKQKTHRIWVIWKREPEAGWGVRTPGPPGQLRPCPVDDYYHIIDTPLNFSNHLPIAIIIDIDSSSFVDVDIDSPSDLGSRRVTRFLRWDHGDKPRYHELPRLLFEEIDRALTQLVVEKRVV